MSRQLEPETSMEDIEEREQYLIEQDTKLRDQREAIEGRMHADFNEVQKLNRRQRELSDQLKVVRRARLAKGHATSSRGAEKRSGSSARNEPSSRNRLGVGEPLFVRTSTREANREHGNQPFLSGDSEGGGEDFSERKDLTMRDSLRYHDKDSEALHLPAAARLGKPAFVQRQRGTAHWAEPPRVSGDTRGLFVSPDSSIHGEEEPSLPSRLDDSRKNALLSTVGQEDEAASDRQDPGASDDQEQGEESRATSRKRNADAVTGSSSDEAPLSYKMKARKFKAQGAVAAGVRKMKGRAEATFDGIQKALRRGRARQTSPSGHAGSPPMPTASGRKSAGPKAPRGQSEDEERGEDDAGEESSQEKRVTAYDRMQAIEQEGKARGMSGDMRRTRRG